MIRFRGLLSVLFFGVLLSGRAQELSHAVHFPGNNSGWTVTFEPQEAKKDPANEAAQPLVVAPVKTDPALIPPQIKKMVVSRAGNLRRDIVTWSDSKTTEVWWMQNPAFLFEDQADGTVGAAKAGNKSDQRYDETIFDWVGAGTFKGIEELKKKKCRYYEKEVTLPNLEKVILSAWIDVETSFPRGWSSGGGVALFSFEGQPAPGALTLPERFQAKLQKLMSFYGPPVKKPAKK